jgi:hypothetical protein
MMYVPTRTIAGCGCGNEKRAPRILFPPGWKQGTDMESVPVFSEGDLRNRVHSGNVSPFFSAVVFNRIA